MRAFVVHDKNGNIARLAICPPDGPALFPPAGPGEMVAEVELPDDAIDFDNEQRTVESLKKFRVEAKTEARLVRRTD